jgi:hypothetical protein
MIIGCPYHCLTTSLSIVRTGIRLLLVCRRKSHGCPCICEPAREAESRGRGMGHLTLWCGMCSVEDHRDTRFYEPPHQVGYSGPVSGWMTQPDA